MLTIYLMKKLIHNKTSVTNINYYLIWCPKYRRKVLIGNIEKRLKGILPSIAEGMGCKIETMEIRPDHVHVFLRGVPTLPVHLIVRELKGKTSKVLREEFPELRSKLPSLWTRSYYCETIGCISEETVKKYIENQKNN